MKCRQSFASLKARLAEAYSGHSWPGYSLRLAVRSALKNGQSEKYQSDQYFVALGGF
jgi:hypothetical protein